MHVSRVILFAILAVLIGVPVALAPRDGVKQSTDAKSVVIFTPHHESIRYEFKRGFEAWHLRQFGEAVEVVWSTPGGTSEIRKMLEAAYVSALRRGVEVGGQGDLLFGGGSYEFTQLAKGLSVETSDGPKSTTVLAPVALEPALLQATYGGRTHIGDKRLYDPKGMWFGTALSGFGIVFNRDVLARLGLPEPRFWRDLCDARYDGALAMVNPAQSGSVATAYEAILHRRGWSEGWKILRRMAANARTFSASSPKAPTDVSWGEAAAGICIDFYGRYQSQALINNGDVRSDGLPRVGYIDPEGETVIDPDPIALLRGAPNPELAERFIRYTLSEEGQSLWNFVAREERSTSQKKSNAASDGLGPERYELRRMPVLQSIYDRHFDRLIDRVNPYTLVRIFGTLDPAYDLPLPEVVVLPLIKNNFYRAFLPSLFVAMAIENRELAHDAWEAIITHPAYPKDIPLVTADQVSDATLRAMLEHFDAMPSIPMPGGASASLADPDATTLDRLQRGWLKKEWRDARLWPEDAAPGEVLRALMTRFFREQYQAVLRLRAEADGRGAV